jgi:hypothetical protein
MSHTVIHTNNRVHIISGHGKRRKEEENTTSHTPRPT